MTIAPVVEQLKVLIELQKLDGEIYRLRREAASKPAQVAELKDAHQKFTQGLQTAESRYKTLEVKRNQHEQELGQKEEQIKKLQVQLFAVKNNKEYSALQKEIEGAKADKSVLEEQILKLMDEVDAAKAQMNVERGQAKTREGELATQVSAIEAQAKTLQDSIKKLQESRAELTPKVEAPILAKYERILERKEGMALAPVRSDACGGCNMVLPPQAINEVMTGTRLVPCESCARILYIEAQE